MMISLCVSACMMISMCVSACMMISMRVSACMMISMCVDVLQHEGYVRGCMHSVHHYIIRGKFRALTYLKTNGYTYV
jgi:hypothetical protein